MKRVLTVIVGVGVLVLGGMIIYAWEPAIPKVPLPEASRFSQAQISRGKMLAGIGNCSTCHTNEASRPNAGGLSIPTPFGTLYTPNITPDPQTGIGHWSEAAFIRAMREGVDREGEHLFPAFPYTHFTKVKDEDLTALYAYLMTRKPVEYEPPANTLRFPYNIRMLQAGWKVLFFDDSPWKDVDGKSDAWNRGAYLAEGLGHCAACHSPRNQFGAEQTDASYAGAMVDQWYAPALDKQHEAPVDWTMDESFDYLRTGGSALHGVAVGSMADVVHAGLAGASGQDIEALATYLGEIGGAGSTPEAMQKAKTLISKAHRETDADMTHGGRIFAAACVACHYNDSRRPNTMRPDLALNSTVTLKSPDNLIRVVLDGVSVKGGLPGVMMPGFGHALNDNDIADLLAFLRRTHNNEPPWPNLAQRVAQLRNETNVNSDDATE